MKNLLLGAFLVLLTGCNIHSDMKDDLDKLFANTLTANQPGGVILIASGDSIIYLNFGGIADMGDSLEIDKNTIFNTGSISKTFVSNGILVLQEEGLLSIDDPLSKYFNFDNPGIADSIRIRHLLAHCSGIPDLRNIEGDPEFYMTARDSANFEPLKHATSLNFSPGDRFEYSNPAFNGLALIIEQVTGLKWQDFIKERIFKPAGMNNSLITDGPYPETSVAHAYDMHNGMFTENDYGEFPTFTAAGNGGIWCSAPDLVLYENAIRNHLFLSEESINLSRTVFHPDNWADSLRPLIGCSWFILEKDNPDNDFGVKIVYHTGSQGGFRAFFYSVPEKDILYVGLFNKPPENMPKMVSDGLDVLKKQDWLEAED